MGVFRLFLALSVLLGHTRGHGFFGLSFLDPAVAVQTFFMISGFYMALVLNEKYNKPGEYGVFIRQRFLRIYPTYLILIAFVLLISFAMWGLTGQAWGPLKSWHDNGHLLSPLKIAYVVLNTVIIFGQDLQMLVLVNPATGAFSFDWPWASGTRPLGLASFLLIMPSWSLAVELCFYLVAPFIVRRAVWIQLVVLALGFALRMTMFQTFTFDAFHSIYYLFPPNLCFFVAGSLGYALYRNYAPQLQSIAATKKWIFALFGLLAIDYARLPHGHELYLIFLPLAFVMIPLLFTATRLNRTDRLIGELSYPCYLIHSLVLSFTLPNFQAPKQQWLLGPVSCIAAVVLSYLFYRFIETKTEQFREHLYEKSKRAFADRKPLPTVDAAT